MTRGMPSTVSPLVSPLLDGCDGDGTLGQQLAAPADDHANFRTVFGLDFEVRACRREGGGKVGSASRSAVVDTAAVRADETALVAVL